MKRTLLILICTLGLLGVAHSTAAQNVIKCQAYQFSYKDV